MTLFGVFNVHIYNYIIQQYNLTNINSENCIILCLNYNRNITPYTCAFIAV